VETPWPHSSETIGVGAQIVFSEFQERYFEFLRFLLSRDIKTAIFCPEDGCFNSMQISEQALKEFEEIWRQDNPDKEITKEQLAEIAQRVLSAVKLIFASSAEHGKRDISHEQ